MAENKSKCKKIFVLYSKNDENDMKKNLTSVTMWAKFLLTNTTGNISFNTCFVELVLRF